MIDQGEQLTIDVFATRAARLAREAKVRPKHELVEAFKSLYVSLELLKTQRDHPPLESLTCFLWAVSWVLGVTGSLDRATAGENVNGLLDEIAELIE